MKVHEPKCNCDSCQNNLNDPNYKICPRCGLPQVTYSPIWGDGYCVNCMRVTIKSENKITQLTRTWIQWNYPEFGDTVKLRSEDKLPDMTVSKLEHFAKYLVDELNK